MAWQFGAENEEGLLETQGARAGQLGYPLDAQSKGALTQALKDVLPGLNRFQEITLESGTTEIDVANSDVMGITANAAVTLAKINNATNGQKLILLFRDSNVTITDDGSGDTNTVNLESSFTSSNGACLFLTRDDDSWYEIGRSDVSPDLSNLDWTTTTAFSVTDADTVAWGAGTLTTSDGTSYSIGAGNTGNMSAATYIYLDTDTSTTAYQTSTTATDAVGANKILVAKAENGTGFATFQVFSGIGGASVSPSQMSGVSLLDMTHDITFSVTDANTVAWGAGTITFADGSTYSIGGNNTGNMAARTYIYLDPDTSTTELQTTTTASSSMGQNKKLIAVAEDGTGFAVFQVFGGTGGASLSPSQMSGISLLEMSHDITFSSSDSNTIGWTSGTITLSDGSTYSIDSGNTGNMSAFTYIYLDPESASDSLLKTTTAATATGPNKRLVGVAQNQTTAASFIPYGPGEALVEGDNIAAGSIFAANIAANTITASEIAANTITASQIDANTITASEMNVSQLSAIAADMGAITAGTVTGATIRTADTGSRFEMDSISFDGYDTANAKVFQVVVDGADAGDVVMGDTSMGHAIWDASDSSFNIFADNVQTISLSPDFNDMTNNGSTASIDNFEMSFNFSSGGNDIGSLVTDAAKADLAKTSVLEFDGAPATGTQLAIFMGIKATTTFDSNGDSGVNFPSFTAGAMTEDHAGFIIYDCGSTIAASVSDGTTQAITDISPTAFQAVYNRYKIVRKASSINFVVNDTILATHTSNLPDDTACAIAFGGVIGGGSATHLQVRQGWRYSQDI